MKTVKLKSRLLMYLCIVLLALALTVTCFGCTNKSNTPSGNEDPTNPPSSSGDTSGDPSQEEPPKQEQPPEIPPLWASNFNLPDADIALNKLVDIYGGKDKVFLLLNNNVARMPCPQGEVITVNTTFEMGEYTKLILEDSLAEFNEVFASINPNYKFTINYTPSEDDFANKYSVKLSASNNLAATETSQVFGVAHVSYENNYTELSNFGITIKTEVFNNGSYLATTFKHELMHLLGAGDAYKNSSATKDTVMQSYTVDGYHSLSKTDVAFLDALYRNPEFEGDNERIQQYINNYEENCQHTKTKLTCAVYNKLVTNLDSTAVKKEASELGYKDLNDFFATVSSGIFPDATFGSVNISFKEIEYAEAQSETYYGSINAQNKRYEHGRQKGLGGDSQTVGYVDYGNGILYSAPNGNLYTILIKTGDYVLAFRLGGSFTNLADLSLTLWHVSK